MTLRELASEIAKREGLKKQVSIGNIREVLRIICEMDAEAVAANTDMNGPLACLARAADSILEKRGKVIFVAAKHKPKKKRSRV